MKITENFNRQEFDSKDGMPYPEEWIESRLKPLCQVLEIIREASGGPLHITSGYRSPSHNKKVGGAVKSKHVEGIAVDIVSRKISPMKLNNLIEKLIEDGKIPEGGLGMYASWCHYDMRGSKARWVNG
jgi:uncharacterized protein YcbK (DUF882 family)